MFFRFKYFIVFIILLSSMSKIEADSSLFIVSDPIGADITINGKLLEEKTPLLLRNLNEGEYLVVTNKGGYFQERKKVDLPAESVEECRFFLKPEFLLATVEDDNQSTKTIQINPGSYTIEENQNSLEITPEYPYQGLINGLNISVPLLSGFSVAMTINEVSNPHVDGAVISPFLIATYILNTVLIGADIGFHIHKSAYLKEVGNQLEAVITNRETIEELYRKGNSKLEIGDFATALKDYGNIIANHQDSIYYPLAIYKTGTIKMILLEMDEAESLFTMVAEDLPMPEIYNKSLRKLIEIKLRKSQYSTVLDYLEQILLTVDFTEKEEIQRKKCEIMDLWSESDPTKLNLSIICWKNLINDFPESENKNTYIYSLAVKYSDLGQIENALNEIKPLTSTEMDSNLLNKILQLQSELELERSIHLDES